MTEDIRTPNLRLHVSVLDDTALLTDEEFGRLVRYGLHYVRGDADCLPPGKEELFVPLLKRYIDTDNERYVAAVEQRREASRKRWKKDADESVRENATASDRIRENPKTQNTKQITDISKEIGIGKRRFTPPSLSQVSAYCAERKNKVDPERFYNFYASKGWMVGKNKMVDWKAAVRTWEKEDGKTSGKDWEKDFEEWLNNGTK